MRKILAGMLLLAGAARAADAIGYKFVSEAQLPKTKGYSTTFEVWSADRDVQLLTVTPSSETPGLEVLTPAKTWKGRIRRGEHKRMTVSVRNATKETANLKLDIHRVGQNKKGDETDSVDDNKIVSVLVAPQ